MFVLCAGRIKTTQAGPSGEQVTLRLVGPGEAFGALDVGTGSPYPSGAEALQASHALLWDRGALDQVAEQHPVILRNMLRIVAERLRSLEHTCRELATVRVSARVAAALARLAVQIGQAADGGVLVALGREDIAQMTGTTPFTVSRLLADWECRGYLRSKREAVLLIDGPGLARHVAADSRRSAAAGETAFSD